MLYVLSGIYALGWTDETAIFRGQKLIFPVHMARPNKRSNKEFPGSPVVTTLLSLPRAQVHSLVRELRFHKPCGVAKKNIFNNIIYKQLNSLAFNKSNLSN